MNKPSKNVPFSPHFLPIHFDAIQLDYYQHVVQINWIRRGDNDIEGIAEKIVHHFSSFTQSRRWKNGENLENAINRLLFSRFKSFEWTKSCRTNKLLIQSLSNSGFLGRKSTIKILGKLDENEKKGFCFLLLFLLRTTGKFQFIWVENMKEIWKENPSYIEFSILECSQIWPFLSSRYGWNDFNFHLHLFATRH